MTHVAVLLFSLVLQQAPAAPTRDEKVQALSTLARAWASYTDPASPHKQMVGMGIVGLVQDLAGTAPTDTPAEQEKKMKPVLAELAKRGVDVSGPVNGLLLDFRRFECRSKQSEAKSMLKSLYVAEESFRAEFDAYDKDFSKIGFQPMAEKPRYRVEILTATKTAFKARAIGVGDMAGDEWTITQENDLQNTKNACPK